MKVRIEHTFNLDETDLELARMSYDTYADSDESFRDYIKSCLISQATSWFQSIADESGFYTGETD